MFYTPVLIELGINSDLSVQISIFKKIILGLFIFYISTSSLLRKLTPSPHSNTKITWQGVVFLLELRKPHEITPSLRAREKKTTDNLQYHNSSWAQERAKFTKLQDTQMNWIWNSDKLLWRELECMNHFIFGRVQEEKSICQCKCGRKTQMFTNF